MVRFSNFSEFEAKYTSILVVFSLQRVTIITSFSEIECLIIYVCEINYLIVTIYNRIY